MSQSDDDSVASRRDRILQAAVYEFADKGRAGVRVDEIASRAGVNKALIYYYFDSKDGLYEAVLERMTVRESPHWKQTASSSFQDWQDAVILRSLDPESHPWTRLMTMEGLEDGGPGTAAREDLRKQVWKNAVSHARRCQDSGELDPQLDPEIVALMFTAWPLLTQVFPQFTRMTTGLSSDSTELKDRLRTFERFVIARLKPLDGHPRAEQ